jgi:hypothetical protein
MVEEVLVLPQYGMKEVPWPFTAFGKSLDELLKQKDIELNKKEYMDRETENQGFESHCGFMLKRSYDSYDIEVEYKRELGLNMDETSDFGPDEITCYRGRLYVPLNSLLEKLKDGSCAWESVSIDANREGYDLRGDPHYLNNVYLMKVFSNNLEVEFSIKDKGILDCFSNFFGEDLKNYAGYEEVENEVGFNSNFDIENFDMMELVSPIIDRVSELGKMTKSQ